MENTLARKCLFIEACMTSEVTPKIEIRRICHDLTFYDCQNIKIDANNKVTKQKIN
jgi:hypothetical protein